MSGRGWPPTAPEFREVCLSGSKEKHPPFEICVVEINNFVRYNRKDTYNMTPFVYHMVVKNLDFYNFKMLEKEYDRNKALEIAYKATLFQLESGEKLIAPPPPETLIEQKKQDVRREYPEDFKSPISDILKLFDEPQDTKPLTEAEMLDNERLERISKEMQRLITKT